MNAPIVTPAPAPAPASGSPSLPPTVDWRTHLAPVTALPLTKHHKSRVRPLLMLLVLVAGGAAGYWYWSKQQAVSTDDAAVAGPGGAEVFVVGQTGTTADLQATVHQVVDPWSSTVAAEVPQPGNRFVAVELTLTNLSDDPQRFSTLLGLELQDAAARTWGITFAGSELPTVEGDLVPGGSRRGFAVFQVPVDATGLQLRVRGTVITGGVIWQL